MTICNILGLSGGGSYGAIEVGILSQLQLQPIDIITGISAGGLNAGLLSYYFHNISQGIDKLHEMYTSLSDDQIYSRDLLNIEKSWSYYSTEPLRQTIHKELETNEYIVKGKTVIGATNIYTGLLDKFQFETFSKQEQEQILLATSAIPLLFPPVSFQDQLYVDGGVIANEILYGFEQFTTCDYYNITFIASHAGVESITHIDSLTDYVKRLFSMVITDFDNELSEIISEKSNGKCSNLKGEIHYYYPDPDKLASFSVLDFSHGEELFALGQQHHIYEYYPYCQPTQRHRSTRWF